MRTKLFWIAIFALASAFAANLVLLLFAHGEYLHLLEFYLRQNRPFTNPVGVFGLIQFSFINSAILLWMALKSPEGIASPISEATTLNKVVCAIMVALWIFYDAANWVFVDAASWRSISKLFSEDGLFESATAFFALQTSFLLLIAAFDPNHRAGRPLHLAASFLFFLFCMEEISWGQRYFGWQTPEALVAMNYQHEINIHNLFNPILYTLNSAFTLLMAVLLLDPAGLRSKLISLFRMQKLMQAIPFQKLALFGYIFLGLGIQPNSGELLEEILSIFGVAYAMNLLMVGREGFAQHVILPARTPLKQSR